MFHYMLVSFKVPLGLKVRQTFFLNILVPIFFVIVAASAEFSILKHCPTTWRGPSLMWWPSCRWTCTRARPATWGSTDMSAERKVGTWRSGTRWGTRRTWRGSGWRPSAGRRSGASSRIAWVPCGPGDTRGSPGHNGRGGKNFATHSRMRNPLLIGVHEKLFFLNHESWLQQEEQTSHISLYAIRASRGIVVLFVDVCCN